MLALGVLLWGLGDGEACRVIVSLNESLRSCLTCAFNRPRLRRRRVNRTWWKRLAELLGLVGVLKDESVKEAVASDLELGLVLDRALLYPRSCRKINRQLSSSRN